MARRRRAFPEAPSVDHGAKVRLEYVDGVYRSSAAITPTAGCHRCGQFWEGRPAASAARKHARDTGHPTWMSTGRLAIHQPRNAIEADADADQPES